MGVSGVKESIQTAARIQDGNLPSRLISKWRSQVVSSGSPSHDPVAELPSCAAWHFGVDTNGVFAVIALYDQDSLPAFESGGYESVDSTV